MSQYDNFTNNEKPETTSSPSDKNKMEIEITKYKGIVKTFGDPSSLVKLILVVSIILIVLFTGVTLIALMIKKFYPYKVLETNLYGATLIKNEDTEIIYWLLNSADLWANSGIEVKKGDVISIRTSGSAHMSLHHLVDNAHDNTKAEIWVQSNGTSQTSSGTIYEKQNTERDNFRIAPKQKYGVILMQVLPKEIGELGPYWYKKTDELKKIRINKDEHFVGEKYMDYIDGGPKRQGILSEAQIYTIGSGTADIEINTDGLLFFSVNDIALTDRVCDFLYAQKDGNFDTIKIEQARYAIKDNHSSFKDNHHLEQKDANTIDTINKYKDYLKKYHENPNELSFYKDIKYTNAWFDDNLGSFLIIVERKKKLF